MSMYRVSQTQLSKAEVRFSELSIIHKFTPTAKNVSGKYLLKEIILEDKRNILRNDLPFDYKLLKDEKAQVFYKNKLVKLLTGNDYAKLIRAIDEDNSYLLQLFMAKVTGNFKR